MKITIFGGSGRTGVFLVRQALSAGHRVTALVRNPERALTQNVNLVVVPGSLQDTALVSQAIQGAQAVLSVLGPRSNQPVYEISAGMDNILAAMQQHGVRRLIVSAGAGLGDPEDIPGLPDRLVRLLLKKFARYAYEDMRRTVEKVRASDTDWTVVRAPMLTDAPYTGKIRLGYLGKGVGMRLCRADLADFMLRQLNDTTYIRKSPVVSN